MQKTVLVLAPHTDDGEFGCGGAIARWVEEGCRVVYVAFSTCEESVPQGFPRDILAQELLAAMDSFGIPKEDVIICHFPVRHFTEHRQEILDQMISVGRTVDPDIVLMPSLKDVHQDHHVIAEEAMRAFKRKTLLGYEEAWNDFSFQSQLYVRLEESHVRRKLAAIACYQTQAGRPYSQEDFLRGLLRVHGTQAGCQYAEAFEVMRWMM